MAARVTGSEVRGSILIERNDDVRTFGDYSGAAMALDGIARGAERLDPVWTFHGVSLRDPTGSVVEDKHTGAHPGVAGERQVLTSSERCHD